jgi:hypothetical protein
MAITLGAITLPAGLMWADEFDWTPVMQSSDYSLTGALIVQTAGKLAGRPITLTGQSDGLDHTAWISRAALLTLQTALDGAGAEFTLTLHDARTFTVMANGPVKATPLPAYKSLRPANPDSDHWYVLESVPLITVA